MTNKEASEWFKKRAQDAPMPGAREAFKLAAEALANADVPGKNVGDTISRQAAIDALDEYFKRIGKLKRRGLNKGEKAISLDTVGAIKSLPSAQPEQRTGKWIPKDGRYYCGQCGGIAPKGIRWDFCPNCGAKMEGDAE